MNYVCSIELEDVSPKVWRQFQFHPDVTFHQLHQIVQMVMGWTDSHLYEFELGGRSFSVPNPEMDFMADESLDARVETVGSYWNRLKTTLNYTYDFGDGWSHKLQLIGKLDNREDTVPVCLDGERCCPLEDVGGPWGHMNMLEALADPQHPERESLLEWAGEAYDPEAFSLVEVNVQLQQHKAKFTPKGSIGSKRTAQSASGKDKPGDGKPKPAKLTKTALKKELKQMSREQLEELIVEGFGSSKEMERFLGVKLGGPTMTAALFLEYRKKVEDEFFPERGFGKLRLQQAKKAITDFWKLTGNVELTLELRLAYVENGIQYSNTYGYLDNWQFFNSIASVFNEAVGMLLKSDSDAMIQAYGARLKEIADDSPDSWDFTATMYDIYYQLGLENEEEEETAST